MSIPLANMAERDRKAAIPVLEDLARVLKSEGNSVYGGIPAMLRELADMLDGLREVEHEWPSDVHVSVEHTVFGPVFVTRDIDDQT